MWSLWALMVLVAAQMGVIYWQFYLLDRRREALNRAEQMLAQYRSRFSEYREQIRSYQRREGL